MRGWPLALLTALAGPALAAVPGLAPQKSWDLGGYVKYMATGTLADEGDNALDHLLHQRFNFEYRFSPTLRLNVGMRNRVLAGDSAELPGYGALVGGDDGYWDLTHNWVDKNGLVATTSFDRLYLHWQDNDWQLQGGRFRINWAMASLWNPNDLFNAYSIYDFDYEERAGSDAVQISRTLGFASQLDLVYNPAKDSELTSYAGRYLFNHRGWDGQLLLGKSGLDHVVGLGFAGDLAGAGVRGELSYFDPTRDHWQGEALSSATVATLESDYSLGGRRNWMVRGALLYISAPQDPDSALAYLNLPLTARTLSFTRWTGYGDLSFELSPLSRLTLSATGYDDGSLFVGMSADYSLANDWQLLGVVQRFDGTSDSLFGATPATLLFGQLRWNF
ncbi:hypothetical protein [Ferrimonas balearica]|uniref:hypothetical protein n=1 Tax=Ferrimonas balearica TaxID=44012 RepID=UPI001C9924EC|nr:hypothetical protein [Ferrimonas balearica]MBY5991223.1 hypothetical protein [Ferrimonas balearica]